MTQAVRGRQTINPRTVLGFYATVLGLMLTGTVAAVGVLASTKTYTTLIPWLLGFAGIMLFLLLSGVFIITLINPSHLMLGQITGTEFAEIQRTTTLGDSTHGERVVLLTDDDQAVEASTVPGSRALPMPPSEEKQVEGS